MSNSVEYWLSAEYKKSPPVMAADALPSKSMTKRIEELFRQWTDKFNDMAEKIADEFAKSSFSHADNAFKKALIDAGWAVEFKMTRGMRDALNATIEENIGLIKSIPQQYLQQVQGSVMRGFSAGRDLKSIVDDLKKHHAVTDRRAALIARDQCNKATAVVTKARRIELGITKAIWQHSHGGKEPRQSHVKADGKEFDVEKGMYIDGEWIQPGELINCRCTSKTVLPF